jgi:hypothetical protein
VQTKGARADELDDVCVVEQRENLDLVHQRQGRRCRCPRKHLGGNDTPLPRGFVHGPEAARANLFAQVQLAKGNPVIREYLFIYTKDETKD